MGMPGQVWKKGTEDECAEQCKDTHGCNYFSYGPFFGGMACALSTGAGGTANYKGWVSGRPDCRTDKTHWATNPWSTRGPYKMKSIAVCGERGQFVLGVDTNGYVKLYDDERQRWPSSHLFPKETLTISCGGEADDIWITARNPHQSSNVWHKDGLYGEWTIAGGMMREISVGGEYGQHVYAIDMNYNLMYRQGLEGRWRKIEGPHGW